MIGHLKGKILQKDPPELLVEAGGIGYEVTLPLSCFGELGDINTDIEIYIHTLVREDLLQLYGFVHFEERILFRELIKTSGIGAKMAIAILSSMSVNEFCLYVKSNDSDSLTKLPGVGKKTAERLLIDMRDRLKNLSLSHPDFASSANQTSEPLIQQAINALTSLGYKPHDAHKLIMATPKKDVPLPELIKSALKIAYNQ